MQINDLASPYEPAKEIGGPTDEDAEPNKSDQKTPVAGSAETHFDIFSVCFSLKGRIPRSVYWLSGIGSIVLFYFCVNISSSVFAKDSATAPLVLLLFFVVFIWSQVAISVKRFHDLGMSGFWVLLLLVPGIGQLVQFFILGFRGGERGENKYGGDPLELFN